MSVNFNDVVKEGNAKVKNKLGMWNQSWVTLRRPSSKGPLRIEKHPDEKAAMLVGSPGKSIELKDVVEISRIPKEERKCAVSIQFGNDRSFRVAFTSESEAEAWLDVLRDLCVVSQRRSGPPGVDILHNSNLQDVFNVCLLQTPAMNVFGECLLQVTSDCIYLLDIESPTKRIMVWPLNCLRRYSRDETKFMFESGRSCKTGEGLFIFNTLHGEEIYQKVWQASKLIAETYRIMNQTGRSHTEDPMASLERRTIPLPPVPRSSGHTSPLPPVPVPPRRF